MQSPPFARPTHKLHAMSLGWKSYDCLSMNMQRSPLFWPTYRMAANASCQHDARFAPAELPSTTVSLSCSRLSCTAIGGVRKRQLCRKGTTGRFSAHVTTAAVAGRTAGRRAAVTVSPLAIRQVKRARPLAGGGEVGAPEATLAKAHERKILHF